MTQSTAAISRNDRDGILPWPLIGAGLAAMAALYFTRGQFNGLIVLAILLIASRLTAWRLPRARIISWGVRLGILIVVLVLFRDQSTIDSTVWYLNEYDTKIGGYAVAAELVLRAWERPAPGRARESRGMAVLVTAIIFMAATHTYERDAIQRITPLFMISILLTLRSFARMGQPLLEKKTLRRGLLAMRAVLLLVTLSIALAATSLITRFENQISSWSTQLMKIKHDQSAEIGFSMDPTLGRVSNPQPTMDRILLIDGPPAEQHLRVMAFDTYASPRWLPAMGDRTYKPADLRKVPSSGSALQFWFKRVSDTANLLPLPLEAQKIEARDPLQEDSLAALRDQESDSNPRYGVSVPSTPAFQGPLCVEPDAQQKQRLLAIPALIDPKVIALARQVAGPGDSSQRLSRIQLHLQSHHAYSLSFDPRGEPLSDFILNDRSAHCQYFASAVVMMARAAGIPARFVSGFYVHERYGSDQMVVRSRDAHAWAECWIDGVGWVTVDATPAGGRPDALFADAPAWKRWWEKLTDWPEEIRVWAENPGPVARLGAVMAVVVVIAGWIIRRMLRRRRRSKSVQDGYAQPSAELAALARRFEKWLRKRHNACPPQRTWRDHLASAALPAEFVQTYNRARFGGDGPAIIRAGEILRRLEQA